MMIGDLTQACSFLFRYVSFSFLFFYLLKINKIHLYIVVVAVDLPSFNVVVVVRVGDQSKAFGKRKKKRPPSVPIFGLECIHIL